MPGELLYALTKVGVKCLIMAPGLKTSNYISMITDLCPELATHSPTHTLTELAGGDHGYSCYISYPVISLTLTVMYDYCTAQMLKGFSRQLCRHCKQSYGWGTTPPQAC